MWSIAKLYIKLFLAMIIAMAIPLLVTDAISGEYVENWKYFILPIVSGFILTSILIIWHVVRLRKLGIKEFTAKNILPTQIISFDTEMTKENLLEKLKVSEKVRKLKDLGETISFHTAGWYGFHKVEIAFLSRQEGKSQIKVISRPSLNTALLDYGASWENVNYVKQLAS